MHDLCAKRDAQAADPHMLACWMPFSEDQGRAGVSTAVQCGQRGGEDEWCRLRYRACDSSHQGVAATPTAVPSEAV